MGKGKKQIDMYRRGFYCESSAGHNYGKSSSEQENFGSRWNKRVDTRNGHHSRKIDLIPRAKLRQQSPDYRGGDFTERQVKHSASCCGSRGKQEVERTWSDSGHYARPRPVYCEEKGGGIEKRYVRYEKNFSPEPKKRSFCTLKRNDLKQMENLAIKDESDVDYYTATSSDGGGYESTKGENSLPKVDVDEEEIEKNVYRRNEEESTKLSLNDSTENRENVYNEKRNSSSPQLQETEKQNDAVKPNCEENTEIRLQSLKKEEREIIESAAAEVVREITETVARGNYLIRGETEEIEKILTEKNEVNENIFQTATDSVTLVTDRRLSRKELNDEINKFIGKRGSSSTLYDSTSNISNGETFLEEEYSYEPELKKSSSKLVMRTRSLLNLEEENKNHAPRNRTIRPLAARTKITTGPDGTFVIAGRKASSELNLSDENGVNSTKIERFLSGEELRKRKEEIFKNMNAPQPPKDSNKYHEEINKDNAQSTKEIAVNNLKKYLKDNKIGLKELLTNKNVVIIEPYRTEKRVKDVSEYNHRNGDFDQSCRITGATTKAGLEINCNESSNTLPRASKPHQPTVQRHYFYHLIKSKTDPKDEDLPDPDKVKNTRERFQKEVKFRRPEDNEIMLPIAAKIVTPFKSNQSKPRLTPEVRVIYDTQKSGSPELKKSLNKKWTDTGSLSSGVSSDMSCFENEDNNMDDVSHKEYSTDEDDELETCKEAEIHPVSAEVMQKIRACGTTVTYYGGRVISHSHGPVRSPMTMTIMDEIRQGNEANKARSRETYMGVKFRLIKSNSCGSRLELAGTEDMSNEPSKNRFYEDVYGKSLGEELSESKGKLGTMEEEIEEVVEERTNNNYAKVHEEFEKKFGNDAKQPVQSWRALIESRKRNKARELRRSHVDMEFEEFEVANG